jgi:beta-lactam-binding protein with PASTA domain
MLLTIIIAVAIIATVVFLMKKGTIADKNGNNIPDAVEKAAAEAKAEMEEVVAKVKKTTAKKKTTKKEQK